MFSIYKYIYFCLSFSFSLSHSHAQTIQSHTCNYVKRFSSFIFCHSVALKAFSLFKLQHLCLATLKLNCMKMTWKRSGQNSLYFCGDIRLFSLFTCERQLTNARITTLHYVDEIKQFSLFVRFIAFVYFLSFKSFTWIHSTHRVFHSLPWKLEWCTCQRIRCHTKVSCRQKDKRVKTGSQSCKRRGTMHAKQKKDSEERKVNH